MTRPAHPPWPVALITGFLGSGKTTLVRALLTRDGMADTMVVVNEFGAIGIDHELIAAVHGDVVLLRGGCLCCGVRQDLARTLRDLHVQWRTGAIPDFARVVIETSGLADPGPVAATIGAHPLVCDAYVLRGITTVVEAEHGAAQLSSQPIAGRQAAVADRILISKPDRVAVADRATLARRLRGLNPAASVGISLFGDAARTDLFAVSAPRRPARRWAEAVDMPHASEAIVCVTLACHVPIDWSSLQRWIGGLLDTAGDRLLRIKGLLDIAGEALPVVLQAVHHTLYQIEYLPQWSDRRSSVLVLIAIGELPPDLDASFAACAAGAGQNSVR